MGKIDCFHGCQDLLNRGALVIARDDHGELQLDFPPSCEIAG
jgi:hypothetical protein